MSKLKVQMKSKWPQQKSFDIDSFVIHLAFACLPRPRSGPGPVGRDFKI